jgi:uncharacterized repeat protein (TIGR03847 family)
MAQHIELNPATHLTIGTIGEPGQRVFYLQGSQGTNLISLIIEKQQAAVVSDGLEELLDDLQERFPHLQSDPAESILADLRLREPVEPLFRVGNIGLGYNEDLNRIVVVAYEAVGEDEEANMVSFWATREQILAFIEHTRAVVSAGRPICGNCGRPIDPDGHFCPNRNGYKR